MKMQKEVSSNLLIVLAVIFVLVNMFNIVFFLQLSPPVGRAITVPSSASLSFCIHYQPELVNVTNQSLTEMEPFFLDLNYTDVDGNLIEFLDNTTMINISAYTGIINFTPNTSDIGGKVINVTVREINMSCNIKLQDSKPIMFDVWGVSNLSMWKGLDTCQGKICRYINRMVYFFANYSSFYNQTPLNGSSIYCQVTFNFTSNSTNFTNIVNMTFNSTSGLYQYNRTFNQTGNLSWNAFCDATPIWYKPLNRTELINITSNRAPVLRFNLPNITWNEDTTVQYYDLDDYFYDPDDDTLNYSKTSIPGIDITIDSMNRPVFRPQPNYCGNGTVYFFATDPEGLSATSNLVHLRVMCMDEPVQGFPTALEAGGGGGGALKTFCIEYWKCGDYGDCLPTNLRYRSCVDIHNCNTSFIKPNESISCVYVGTCTDSIKNCHDGFCEKSVDCGGFCPPCPTCFDGIKNQGETGIDCGGPCDLCEGEVAPGFELPAIIGQIPGIIEKSLLIVAFIILVLIVILSVISFHIHRYVQPRLAEVIMKAMKALIAVKRKEEEFVSEEAALRISTLLKISELEMRLSRGNLDKISREFSGIMNEFFTSLLHMENALTQEELSKRIEKMNIGPAMKIVIITFIRKLIDLGYGGYAVDRETLKKFVEEAKNVVIVATEKPLVITEVSVEKNLAGRVNNLLDTAEKLVNKDVGKAASLYKRIAELYSMMAESEKIEVYGRIYKLYASIKEKINK